MKMSLSKSATGEGTRKDAPRYIMLSMMLSTLDENILDEISKIFKYS